MSGDLTFFQTYCFEILIIGFCFLIILYRVCHTIIDILFEYIVAISVFWGIGKMIGGGYFLVEWKDAFFSAIQLLQNGGIKI